MASALRPRVSFLDEGFVSEVVDQALRVLREVGVFVEYRPAVDRLLDAGARLSAEGRVLIGPELVKHALAGAPDQVRLYDRAGERALTIGGDNVHFDPGSAAIRVYDYEARQLRPALTSDCVAFARLAEQLPAMALQSTSVVPEDVPIAVADRTRLRIALEYCQKPVVTGTFAEASFEVMRQMLVLVRGSKEALRQRPLAIFDCCPSPPLKWSALTCSVLMGCAEHGIPAELVSMPLTGATAPVTLAGALAQHTAENLSGVVIHQLTGPGAPIIYGGSPSAFDMRWGTTPMGAIETMMLDGAYAQIGKHFGLPTHAYMGLSDAKVVDYQAGLESGLGALLAALAGINVVSGAGMLDFESAQSLEKLVLDHEACAMALRCLAGIERRDLEAVAEVIQQGVASEQFLHLDHTRQWFRQEFYRPGRVIDRLVSDAWVAEGARTAYERAHEEVRRLLSLETAARLDPALAVELAKLASTE